MGRHELGAIYKVSEQYRGFTAITVTCLPTPLHMPTYPTTVAYIISSYLSAEWTVQRNMACVNKWRSVWLVMIVYPASSILQIPLAGYIYIYLSFIYIYIYVYMKMERGDVQILSPPSFHTPLLNFLYGSLFAGQCACLSCMKNWIHSPFFNTD